MFVMVMVMIVMIVMMVMMIVMMQDHLKIRGGKTAAAAFFDPVFHAFQFQTFQHGKQACLICPQIQHGSRKHITADPGGTFQIKGPFHKHFPFVAIKRLICAAK